MEVALVLSANKFIIRIKAGTNQKNMVVSFNKTNIFLVWDRSGIIITSFVLIYLSVTLHG